MDTITLDNFNYITTFLNEACNVRKLDIRELRKCIVEEFKKINYDDYVYTDVVKFVNYHKNEYDNEFFQHMLLGKFVFTITDFIKILQNRYAQILISQKLKNNFLELIQKENFKKHNLGNNVLLFDSNNIILRAFSDCFHEKKIIKKDEDISLFLETVKDEDEDLFNTPPLFQTKLDTLALNRREFEDKHVVVLDIMMNYRSILMESSLSETNEWKPVDF